MSEGVKTERASRKSEAGVSRSDPSRSAEPGAKWCEFSRCAPGQARRGKAEDLVAALYRGRGAERAGTHLFSSHAGVLRPGGGWGNRRAPTCYTPRPQSGNREGLAAPHSPSFGAEWRSPGLPAKGARGHRVRVTREAGRFRGSGSLDFGPKQAASSACPQAVCAFRPGSPGLCFFRDWRLGSPKLNCFERRLLGSLYKDKREGSGHRVVGLAQR